MQYRNEWKFVCDDKDLTQIENKLDKILRLDGYTQTNNKYIVHSLYFDDLNNTCMFDNDAGLGKRYKWRIRCYDDKFSYIRLERKEKLNGMCRKFSCLLSRKQFDDIISNNISYVFWNTDDKLLKQFCIEIMCKKFVPKIIIDYERTAYVEPITNIRITLDRNIIGSIETDKFIVGDYTRYPLQDINKHILEVKFDYVLPSYIKQAAHVKSLKQVTFSKYYLGRLIIERN